ncbi:nitrogen regulatory protein P-II family [Lutibacter sp. Hel_I_33_5]|uniref:P-II family nitrogen regulator n=1 Tax=Lutibacter sp. Hel_I_33_5 TaxID=1566289 RepID=UPI0011A0AD92|nr:P-II family nitrogen regulator [Lutibacter sp. Hel_I_33_5]TVZ54901.1 nitrogen regulatory protein P-II family [Lutibacter sp. Hel_I_33_5]
MKKIEAIIRPSKLKAVQKGLKEAEIPCITAIPVKGTGLQGTYSERYRGTEQSMIMQTRIMIICIVSDENLEKGINVILDNASENLVGDGKIFVYNVEDAIRIRTKTRGSKAII